MYTPRVPRAQVPYRRAALNDRTRKILCGALNWCAMSPTATKLKLSVAKAHFVNEDYVILSFRAYHVRDYFFSVRIDAFMTENPRYTLYEKQKEVTGDRPFYFQTFVDFFSRNVFKQAQKGVKTCKFYKIVSQ